MPSLNAMKRLENALSLYGKTVDFMHQHMGWIDEQKSNALQVLLYVNANMAFFKTTEAYIPEDEIDLLLKAIEELKLYKIDSHWNRSILQDLMVNLITINDLLIQRKTEKADLTKIALIIEQLPGNVLENIHIPESSVTANYLRSQGKSISISPVEVMLDKDKIIEQAKNNYAFESQSDALEKIFKISDSLSDEDLLAGLKALILLYTERTQLDVSKKEAVHLIQTLSEKYTDKEKFVTIFLSAYQTLYGEYYRKDNEKNILLEGIAEFFPILDSLLPPNKLSGFLEGSDSSTAFFLNDPWASEHDESYRIYEDCLSFYVPVDKRKSYSYVSENAIRHLSLILQLPDFYSNLQVSGRNMCDSIRLLASPNLSQLPPVLQTKLVHLFEQNTALQKEFESFIELFIQVNARADEHQQRNIKIFFSRHQEAIAQIMLIMGIEGIRYLRSHLAGTALNLERTLSLVPVLPEVVQNSLIEYCQNRAISFRENPKEIHAITTSMIILNMLIGMRDGGIDNYLILLKDKSPEEYMLLLAKALLDKVFQGIDVTLNPEEINAIFTRITPEKLVSLIAASQSMADNEYRDVYLNLLKLDLTGGDINDFLHNTEQEDSTGKGLAYHNKKISARLVDAKIDSETALNYRKTLNFVVAPNGNETSNQEALFQVLGHYIQQLKAAIDKIDAPERSPELSKLVGFIEKLKNEQGEFVSLNTTSSRNLLGEINKSLNCLAKSNASLPDGFNEFSEHVRTQYNLIKESKRTQGKEKKEYSFSVEQWKKDKIDTFFLGDAVGCCLATTNAQFQAMVQRRMDDAMLFHVAIDQATGKPAALIWLYLAETSDKKIVLMANFFEVNAKYATNDALRLALLNGLLQFTHQYCQDNLNISAFYMNRLSYGWNRNDLNHYDMETVALSDKLGGPYIPGMSADDIETFQEQLLESPEMCSQVKEHTQEKYYLVSLSQTQFHRFNPEKLALVNTVVAKKTTMQESTSSVLQALQATEHTSSKEQEVQRQVAHDRQWGLIVIPKKEKIAQQSSTLPTYKTLLHHHGLLNQPSKEEIKARKQQKQDQTLAIVVRKPSNL